MGGRQSQNRLIYLGLLIHLSEASNDDDAQQFIEFMNHTRSIRSSSSDVMQRARLAIHSPTHPSIHLSFLPPPIRFDFSSLPGPGRSSVVDESKASVCWYHCCFALMQLLSTKATKPRPRMDVNRFTAQRERESDFCPLECIFQLWQHDPSRHQSPCISQRDILCREVLELIGQIGQMTGHQLERIQGSRSIERERGKIIKSIFLICTSFLAEMAGMDG